MARTSRIRPALSDKGRAMVAQPFDSEERELLLGARHPVREAFRDELRTELALMEDFRERLPVFEK